jgi:hypothetical protein
MNRALLIAVLLPFTLLTAYAVHFSGGLLAFLWFFTQHPASWQIFADIAIVLSLLLVFIYRDAKATGRAFWPWAIFSLTCGSFGPLLYFITGKEKA